MGGGRQAGRDFGYAPGGDIDALLWHAFSMPIPRPSDPILARFRAALAEAYGDRLARAVLYGSRARGDAQADSDYDIAIFLHDMPDRFAEMNRLADLGTAILYETGGVVHALPYQAATYDDPRMPLMHEIRAEGLDL
jgi:predicted nucleotidyltransferase